MAEWPVGAKDTPLYQWIKEQEKQYLIRKLSLFGGRIDLTARNCCVGVRTLTRKMRSHGLDKRQFERMASEAVLLTDKNLLTERNESFFQRRNS